jgi:hypothetical protein
MMIAFLFCVFGVYVDSDAEVVFDENSQVDKMEGIDQPGGK